MSTTDCGCRHHAVAQRAWGWAPAGSPCYSRKRGTGGGPKHGPALNLPTSRPRQTRTPTGGTAGTAGMPGWARAGGQALGQYSGGGGGVCLAALAMGSMERDSGPRLLGWDQARRPHPQQAPWTREKGKRPASSNRGTRGTTAAAFGFRCHLYGLRAVTAPRGQLHKHAARVLLAQS